jgi:hypothetical protein
MNYLTTTKTLGKRAAVYVVDGKEVASFPASLNNSIPSLDEVEQMVGTEQEEAKEESKGVEIVRVANGEFKVLKDGKATEYHITNGCLGMSGNGPNVYLISKGSSIKQSGLTLAKAKKLVKHWLK